MTEHRHGARPGRAADRPRDRRRGGIVEVGLWLRSARRSARWSSATSSTSALSNRRRQVGPAASPLAERRAASCPRAAAAGRARERARGTARRGGARSTAWGWIDEAPGVAHMPIEPAIDRLAARGGAPRARRRAAGRATRRPSTRRRTRTPACDRRDPSSPLLAAGAPSRRRSPAAAVRDPRPRATTRAGTRQSTALTAESARSIRGRLRPAARRVAAARPRLPRRDRQGRSGSATTSARKPVLLAFVYYRCPMLCTHGHRSASAPRLKGVPFEPGREFEVVFVSFDPDDTPETRGRAQEPRRRPLRQARERRRLALPHRRRRRDRAR